MPSVAAAPLVAQTSTTFTRCAVGMARETVGLYGPGYHPIIWAYGSPNFQSDVLFDAAVCTDLIATGGWTGVSKYAEWETRHGGLFSPVCNVTWTWGDLILTIYNSPGYRGVGLAECADFDTQTESRLKYFVEGAKY